MREKKSRDQAAKAARAQPAPELSPWGGGPGRGGGGAPIRDDHGHAVPDLSRAPQHGEAARGPPGVHPPPRPHVRDGEGNPPGGGGYPPTSPRGGTELTPVAYHHGGGAAPGHAYHTPPGAPRPPPPHGGADMTPQGHHHHHGGGAAASLIYQTPTAPHGVMSPPGGAAGSPGKQGYAHGSAMYDLRGGPSEDQLAQAERHRQQLREDLDRQVRARHPPTRAGRSGRRRLSS